MEHPEILDRLLKFRAGMAETLKFDDSDIEKFKKELEEKRQAEDNFFDERSNEIKNWLDYTKKELKLSRLNSISILLLNLDMENMNKLSGRVQLLDTNSDLNLIGSKLAHFDYLLGKITIPSMTQFTEKTINKGEADSSKQLTTTAEKSFNLSLAGSISFYLFSQEKLRNFTKKLMDDSTGFKLIDHYLLSEANISTPNISVPAFFRVGLESAANQYKYLYLL